MTSIKDTGRPEPFILVVEDDPSLLENLEDILQFAGYDFVAVSNAYEGFNVLRSVSRLPDLIISNILMPGMDGFQFLLAVRKNRSWANIPFLFISGQEATCFVQDAAYGAVAYMTKPFEVSELLDLVGRMLVEDS